MSELDPSALTRVELVDLEPVLNDRHVPPEQVDEKTFPIGDVDHGVLPFG